MLNQHAVRSASKTSATPATSTALFSAFLTFRICATSFWVGDSLVKSIKLTIWKREVKSLFNLPNYSDVFGINKSLLVRHLLVWKRRLEKNTLSIRGLTSKTVRSFWVVYWRNSTRTLTESLKSPTSNSLILCLLQTSRKNSPFSNSSNSISFLATLQKSLTCFRASTGRRSFVQTATT